MLHARGSLAHLRFPVHSYFRVHHHHPYRSLSRAAGRAPQNSHRTPLRSPSRRPSLQ
ncbi:hypothetical protein BJV77DRAFT_1037018 [Russula vinacea]|nr:hypothetical protein BJV77DRAFT_1037018 [Russula vinacea]